MLINTRDRPPFWGCMLMNFRGRPPIQRGVCLQEQFLWIQLYIQKYSRIRQPLQKFNSQFSGHCLKSFSVHNLERVSIHYAFSLIYTTTSSFNTTPGCVVCGNLITVTLFSVKNTAIQGNSIIIVQGHQEKGCCAKCEKRIWNFKAKTIFPLQGNSISIIVQRHKKKGC